WTAAVLRLLHVLSSLLESASGIGHLAVIIFAGQLVQLTRQTFGFLLQVLRCRLIAASARTTGPLLLGATLLEFLLAFGKLFQFAQCFIDFRRILLLFALLDSL